MEIITRKNINQAPKRLQRMLVSLQDYNFTLIWKPGSQMHISDFLSRHPIAGKHQNSLFEEISSINSVSQFSISGNRTEQIRKEGERDEELQAMIPYIENGWPDHKK